MASAVTNIPVGLGLSLANKAVQELSTAATTPPEKYILKDGIGGIDFPLLEVPVIDLSLLASSSPQGEKEVEKLHLAFSSCGYIQVVNHGMEESFLDEVHGVTKQFFSLPMEEKLKCARPKDHIDGYGNDTVYSENQTLDWNDRLYLVVKPETQKKLNVWPQNPTNFRKVLLEITSRLEKMNEILLKVMAKSLKLQDEDCFVKQFGENPIVLSRFNLYPPCPRPDQVLAAKAHGDASGMTYLLQDKHVEGLQALKDGQWYKVPIIPNAIVVNVGDQLEIMSNGVFKSPIHRVVTNPHKERMTVAIFFTPDATNEVGPAQGLIDDERPKLFNSVVDYSGNYFKSFQAGKRPIDLLKI
ncbi:protein srg1 [Phtheirospermum japonicum]|uniref:Protein srg1 n=1 Tax=Phtheirospermum japonicum TaxID=374723 RepID=A0A830CFS5_9LAMI|nr:protein srg1 [Phtheirospermum japonicum]